MKKVLIVLVVLVIVVSVGFKIEESKNRKELQLPSQVKIPVVTDQSVDQKTSFEFEEGKTYCFDYEQKADTKNPYAVTEHLQLRKEGDSLIGSKTGTQAGPNMTNGYSGTLKGTLSPGELFLVFDYTVEGAKNKELEIYNLEGVSVIKKRYPLSEGVYQGQKMLVPDQSLTFESLVYNPESCQ